MSDARIALAFVARRQGKTLLPQATWVHVLSLELGWMAPAQARDLVAAALRDGLVAPQGDALGLTFDAAAVEIPRGFRPGATAQATESPDQAVAVPPRLADDEDLFAAWLGRVSAATGETREGVLRRIATLQERFGGMLTADAAVLRLAAEAGLDVRAAARAAATAQHVT